jgi:Flp pilus assembly CpaF family ATPase
MVISHGAGSGKTTLLGFISDDERLITIEDAAELRLAKAAAHRGPGGLRELPRPR